MDGERGEWAQEVEWKERREAPGEHRGERVEVGALEGWSRVLVTLEGSSIPE